MPLIFHKNISNGRNLLLWHLIEDEHHLIQLVDLDQSELTELESISLIKRRKEWLVTRLLVKMAAQGKKLNFLPNGKPMLDSTTHISISHNDDLGGVIIAPDAVGLDIQDKNEKLKKISLRFCAESERHDAANSPDELQYITILWCVKEAVFKCYGEHVDFDRHIKVLPFNLNDEWINAEYNGLHGSKSFVLRHLKMNGRHVLVTM